jgi:hypothetical protein
MSISHLITSYGYWAVFVLVGLESRPARLMLTRPARLGRSTGPTRSAHIALTCAPPSVLLCEFWSSRTRCVPRPC